VFLSGRFTWDLIEKDTDSRFEKTDIQSRGGRLIWIEYKGEVDLSGRAKERPPPSGARLKKKADGGEAAVKGKKKTWLHAR